MVKTLAGGSSECENGRHHHDEAPLAGFAPSVVEVWVYTARLDTILQTSLPMTCPLVSACCQRFLQLQLATILPWPTHDVYVSICKSFEPSLCTAWPGIGQDESSKARWSPGRRVADRPTFCFSPTAFPADGQAGAVERDPKGDERILSSTDNLDRESGLLLDLPSKWMPVPRGGRGVMRRCAALPPK